MRLWLLHRNADTKHQRASQQTAIEAHKSYLARRAACSSPTHAHAPCHTLYVNKVPLDSLCSPSCFHPLCSQSVASSPGPNTNTRWHDQEQQQWAIVHLMHSWGGGGGTKQGNFCNVMKFSMQTRKGPQLSQDFWVMRC